MLSRKRTQAQRLFTHFPTVFGGHTAQSPQNGRQGHLNALNQIIQKVNFRPTNVQMCQVEFPNVILSRPMQCNKNRAKSAAIKTPQHILASQKF